MRWAAARITFPQFQPVLLFDWPATQISTRSIGIYGARSGDETVSAQATVVYRHISIIVSSRPVTLLLAVPTGFEPAIFSLTVTCDLAL